MDRRSWTIQEDQAIRTLVDEFGVLDWTNISQKLKERYHIKQRTGKQCRERWYNHLNPDVNKKPWTSDEQSLLFQIHRKSGNKWKLMSKYFEGRTDNDIKNHFYSTLRRSLRRLNKYVGEKNSTTQMREIKPSVLSTIMNYIYEQQNNIQTSIVNSLKDLPYLIFQFSNFKPVKNKLKVEEDEQIKTKINFIFSLINSANSTYQNLKQANKSQKNKKTHPHPNPIDDQSKKQKLSEVDFIKYLPKKTYASVPSIDLPLLAKKSKERIQKGSKRFGSSEIKLQECQKQKDPLHTDFVLGQNEHHSEFLVKASQQQSEYFNSNRKRDRQKEHEDFNNLQQLGNLRARRISLQAYEDFMEDDPLGDVEQPSQVSGFYCPGGSLQELVVVGKQIAIHPGEVELQLQESEQHQNIDELIEMNYSN